MNIKNHYLLNASLETLHFETKEWIEEVRFWLDEIEILHTLVDRKMAQNKLEDQIHRDLQLNLRSLLDRLSDQTINELLEHERYLSGLISIKEVANQEAYRQNHGRISLEMVRLRRDVRALKIKVLQFLERKEFERYQGTPKK
ncbi:hypothetical protein [Flagellimonas beolgyonensis]|uniref:hypothetical protein n=1 Tax=Flagellimonas beolgyonensis TaxID=864064 RepID=UPI003D64FEBB